MSTGESQRILIVGVGGQGVVFTSKVIGGAFMDSDMYVAMSEVHGMAQRGGVVTCHMCAGDLHSPIIGEGEADILLSFEPIEAYRILGKANPETTIVTNKAMFIPVSVNVGKVKYPDLDNVLSAIKEVSDNFIAFNATRTASEIGSYVVASAVMMGALAGTGKLIISTESLREQLLSRVPPKSVEMNENAFNKGFEITKEALSE